MNDMPTPSKPILVTHSGKFHCDEVFAYAVLRLARGCVHPARTTPCSVRGTRR